MSSVAGCKEEEKMRCLPAQGEMVDPEAQPVNPFIQVVAKIAFSQPCVPCRSTHEHMHPSVSSLIFLILCSSFSLHHHPRRVFLNQHSQTGVVPFFEKSGVLSAKKLSTSFAPAYKVIKGEISSSHVCFYHRPTHHTTPPSHGRTMAHKPRWTRPSCCWWMLPSPLPLSQLEPEEGPGAPSPGRCDASRAPPG